MYQALGIPYNTKSLIYSDALTVDKCLAIKKQCDELNFELGESTAFLYLDPQLRLDSASFGIGTFLTNDFKKVSTGEKSKALNIVIKLSSVNDKPCVKLSDDLDKVSDMYSCCPYIY